MKIAIFSPYATVVPHFDTELEIAQKHLDRGDQVEFVHCVGGLANCDFNIDRDPARCQQCIGRREMGLELLAPTVRVESIPAVGWQPLNLKNDFVSVLELIDYRIDNFDIGFAALSSLVSFCRDPEPDLIAHRVRLNQFLTSALQTFRHAQTYMIANRPDRVYVFNGRFAAMRAVFRACQDVGIDCYLHERGCDGEHYVVLKNHFLHDIPAMDRVIQQTWCDAELRSERLAVAAQWYQNRVDRIEREWFSFVKQQQRGMLPPEWDSSKHNVTIFCSSDDEFVAIGDCWKNELYSNQVVAIQKLATDLQTFAPHVHLTLRVHPNLASVDNPRKRDMLALEFPNLSIIPPESPIDSYELLRASDCVATFGSTVGIEAVYWDRPSVLLGPSMYQNLGGTYRPSTHAEAVQLLIQPLLPLEKIGALMFGFWLQTNGVRYEYFRSSGLFDGQFKGQTLYARPPKKTLGMRIRNEARKLFARL